MLLAAPCGNVDTDLAVIDGDILVGPAPVPEVADGRLGVVESEVAHGELLVSERRGNLASIEDEIPCEAGRACFTLVSTEIYPMETGWKVVYSPLSQKIP